MDSPRNGGEMKESQFDFVEKWGKEMAVKET